jgi:hypothetical protein
MSPTMDSETEAKRRSTVLWVVGLATLGRGPVLFPEQSEGDTRPAQLAMHMGPVGLGLAPAARLRAGAGEQHALTASVSVSGNGQLRPVAAARSR